MLDITTFHEYVDNIAYTAGLLEAVIGDTSNPTSIKGCIQAQQDRTQALADASLEGPLLEALRTALTVEVPSVRNTIQAAFARALVDAIERETGRPASEWYEGVRSVGDRVPAEFKWALENAGASWPAQFTQPPAGTVLGSQKAPGSSLTLALDDEPIDTNAYGGGSVEIIVTGDIVMSAGFGATLAVVITGEQAGGGVVTGSATITHGDTAGTVITVTVSPSVAKFVRATNIVCTPSSGTWTSGSFELRTKYDRAPAA